MAGLEHMHFYRESGKFSPVGVIGAVAASAVTAAILGFVYAYAIYYIPIIYLNFFITLAFGAGVGYVAGFMAKSGKTRNTKVVLLLGLVAGVLALYFQWVFWVGIVFEEVPEIGHVYGLGFLWELILAINENGVWGMGSSGEPVTGIVLWIVWGIEAVMIVGAATFVALMVCNGVFCERCNQWADEALGGVNLALSDELNAVLPALSEGHFGGLKSVPLAGHDDAAYARVDFRSCHRCTEFNTLSLVGVIHQLDKDGNLETKEDPIIEGLLTPSATLKDLRDHWAGNSGSLDAGSVQ